MAYFSFVKGYSHPIIEILVYNYVKKENNKIIIEKLGQNCVQRTISQGNCLESEKIHPNMLET